MSAAIVEGFVIQKLRRLRRLLEQFRKAMGSIFKRPWAVCSKGHGQYVRKAMGSMLERRWVASSKKFATPIFKKFHNINNINNDLLRAQNCVIRL